MIPKSIKWRLQLWYGLILVVVLAGFGFTAYQLERGRQMRRIDDELQRRIGVLANALVARRRADRTQTGSLSIATAGPIPGRRAARTEHQRPPIEFHLPPQAAGLFDASDPNNFYFVIWIRDGKGNCALNQRSPTERSPISFDH